MCGDKVFNYISLVLQSPQANHHISIKPGDQMHFSLSIYVTFSEKKEEITVFNNH